MLLITTLGGEIYAADRSEGPYPLFADYRQTFDNIAAAPDGTIYVTEDDLLLRIDPLADRPIPVARLDADLSGLVFDSAGTAYTGQFLVPGLFIVDLETGALTPRGSAPEIFTDLALFDGTLYAYDRSDDALLALDPGTGELLSRSTLLIDNVQALVADEGRLVAYADRDAFQLDPTTGAATLIVEDVDDLTLERGNATFSTPLDATAIFQQSGQGLTEAEAREVAYLYEAALDRDGDIDRPGVNFWIDARESGLSRTALSQAFLDSEEFAENVADPDMLSDRELVEALYRNVLDREGEVAGVDFWEEVLLDPGFDRADLLLAFAGSPENIEGSPDVADLNEISPGLWDFLA